MATAASEVPEIHSRLTKAELADISEFRTRLAHKTVEDSHKLYYEWARTGQLTRRQHTLLGIYLFTPT